MLKKIARQRKFIIERYPKKIVRKIPNKVVKMVLRFSNIVSSLHLVLSLIISVAAVTPYTSSYVFKRFLLWRDVSLRRQPPKTIWWVSVYSDLSAGCSSCQYWHQWRCLFNFSPCSPLPQLRSHRPPPIVLLLFVWPLGFAETSSRSQSSVIKPHLQMTTSGKDWGCCTTLVCHPFTSRGWWWWWCRRGRGSVSRQRSYSQRL